MGQIRPESWAGMILLLLWLSVSSHATIWTVTYDPEDDLDRIGQVALGAASGDTILVEPGTYYEHIPVDGKSLTFASTDGPETTILDGSQEIDGREGSIFYTSTGDVEDLFVEGFTLRGGQGSHLEYGDFGGGAVAWWNDNYGGSLTVINCNLLENTTAEIGRYLTPGGAIFAGQLEEARIESSTFVGNSAEDWGGAIAFVHSGDLEVSSCSFEVMRTAGAGGAAIFVWNGDTITIQGSEFEGIDDGDPWAYGVEIRASKVHLNDNLFVDTLSPLGTKVKIAPPSAVWTPFVRSHLVGNVFLDNSDGPEPRDGHVRISLSGSNVLFSENTFAGCDIRVHAGGGMPLRFHNNIVYQGHATIHALDGSVSCNTFWPDTVTVGHFGTVVLTDNLSVDPLFCDEDEGDLHIAFQSLCAEDNAPEGCGRIGALPAECELSPVETTSWGRIKAGYK